MRAVDILLLIIFIGVMQACGLFGNVQAPSNSPVDPTSEESNVAEDLVSRAYPRIGAHLGVAPPPSPRGATSLEERIANADMIARVQLMSVSSNVNTARYVEQWWGPYYRTNQTAHAATLEFRFQVIEYLKGLSSTGSGVVGQNEVVVAVVMDLEEYYDVEAEARDALSSIVAARDTRWDDREAIIFLRNSDDSLPSTSQSGRYFLGLLTIGGVDDGYTIASDWNKLWLPAEVASPSVGDHQRFLMDVPSATAVPTITLGDLKTRIAEVESSLNGGDGTDDFKKCVLETYRRERVLAWRLTQPQNYDGDGTGPPDNLSLYSGTRNGITVHEVDSSRFHPDAVHQNWIDGEDSELFRVGLDDPKKRLTSTRPLPKGEYKFFFNNRWGIFVACEGYVDRYEITITVTAPDGVLHELFFDPVTVGSTVSADGANAVLKPASFTASSGSSASIEGISYESGTGDSGTVEVEVDPHAALDGQIVDVIELDGTVSLSLNVGDATVDETNDTLRWAVSSAPWEDGDLLMVRIRRAPPSCKSGVAVSNPGSNAALVSDCETLLALKDDLVGTATLNWGLDTAIDSWDGVMVWGTPKRVTVLNLRNKGLTGVVPSVLGELTGLEELRLGNNQLTGGIPAELGDLVNLSNLQLRYNSLTGEIPTELGSLSALTVLWLHSNQLTGEIPVELGNLSNLEQLWLNTNRMSGSIPWELGELEELTSLQLRGNSFEGCLRASLRSIGDNDLSQLGLTDCTESGRVPTPSGVSATLSEATFTVTWSAVTGAARYEVQHRVSGTDEEWSGLPSTTGTSTTYSPDGGPVCGTTYEFRVRSYGNASTYAAGWSVASSAESVETDACNIAPVFDPSSYAFSVSEDAAVDDAVGTVTATDADEGDTVAYSITAGNGDGKFAIDDSTGEITVPYEVSNEE